MKFQIPLVLFASLLTIVSGEADVSRSHARDFSIELRNDKIPAPAIPSGKDTTKLHVWRRLDTRSTTYDDRHGADHGGLNELMRDTGGKHVSTFYVYKDIVHIESEANFNIKRST
jgi:hypothetical protein